MDEGQPWQITAVRAQGLHLMRPEKSWRPIITIEVDRHHRHETIMGCDGQNPNLKDIFTFHDADLNSRIELKVWRLSQSKKKGKRRNLVALAVHTLGELAKRREHDTTEVEVRLQCQSINKRTVASRGKPQNGATLILRFRPSSVVQAPVQSISEHGYTTESSSSSQNSDTLSVPPSPTDFDIPPPSTLRRRKVRGYDIHSDDVASSDEEFVLERKLTMDSSTFVDDESYRNYPGCPPDGVVRIVDDSNDWVAASLLPQYTEKIETAPPLTRLEIVLSSFTMYSELKQAVHGSHFEPVFARLQMEWTYIGGLLVALAAVNTAVFSISPDSMFTVDSYARSSIAASSIASGLGIACDAWFLLRYGWADLDTFITRSRDLYGSYFFFALSSRVPALCMFISAVSLMAFLGIVAYNVWPQAVLIVCFLVGLVMTLQFLVYGAHWCATKVVAGGRLATRKVMGERTGV